MAFETLRPDVLLTQANLVGAVTDIDDDPDSPDGLWLTWDGSNNSIAQASVPTPTGNPTTGADKQEFRALIRNATGGSNSTSWALQVYEDNSLVVEIATGSDPTEDSNGVVVSGTWDATDLLTADGSLVEIRLIQTAGATGNPGNQKGIEVGALEWNAEFDSGGPSEFDEFPNMTGTGSVSFGRVVSYGRSHSMSGNAAVAFSNPAQHFRAHTFGGAGAVVESHNSISLISASMSGVGSAALLTQNFWDRQFNIGATGSPDIAKQIAKILASSGLGGLTISKDIALARGYAGVGSVSAAQIQAQQVSADMTGTASVAFTTQTSFSKAFAYAGSAAVTIQKHIGKLFGVIATGTASFFHDGGAGEPPKRLILRLVIRPVQRLILRLK